MGAQLTYLKQPITTKEVDDGRVPSHARFGACAMQGWRRGMEDAHLAVPDLVGDGRYSLFGVFDGHGGMGVSRFAVRHLPDLLVATEEFQRGEYAAALTAAFLAVDERLLTPSGREELCELDAPGKGRVPILVSRKQWSQYGRMGPGLQRAARRTSIENRGTNAGAADDDEEMLIDPSKLKEISPEGQGSTAVVALIVWDEQSETSAGRARLIVANAGDSRCILGQKSAAGEVEAFAMSEDHKPELPGEAARIKAGGGQVTVMPGGARINGDLNLSRALGDFRHKQLRNVPPDRQIVTANPEVRECALGLETQLLVLGCDGIWERNENQELVERLHCRLGAGADASRPLLSTLGAEVCDDSLCSSMNAGTNPGFDGSGCDNMTILIVQFDDRSAVAAAAVDTAGQGEFDSEPFAVSSLVAEVLEAAGEPHAAPDTAAAVSSGTSMGFEELLQSALPVGGVEYTDASRKLVAPAEAVSACEVPSALPGIAVELEAGQLAAVESVELAAEACAGDAAIAEAVADDSGGELGSSGKRRRLEA